MSQLSGPPTTDSLRLASSTPVPSCTPSVVRRREGGQHALPGSHCSPKRATHAGRAFSPLAAAPFGSPRSGQARRCGMLRGGGQWRCGRSARPARGPARGEDDRRESDDSRCRCCACGRLHAAAQPAGSHRSAGSAPRDCCRRPRRARHARSARGAAANPSARPSHTAGQHSATPIGPGRRPRPGAAACAGPLRRWCGLTEE